TASPLLEVCDEALYLQSSTVYDRGLIGDLVDEVSSGAQLHVSRLESEMREASASTDGWVDAFAFSADAWPQIVDIFRKARAEDVAELARSEFATDVDAAGWQIRVVDRETASRAADRLFEGCRKDIDGIVSRHLNRHISLAISRRLAPTSIGPNHISALTFVFGILAGIFAAIGGYGWFVAAGVTYQLHSIVDGVDGELARVRYEFSVLGEWLDTLSDDTKDVFFYTGLGVGALRTAEFPLEVGLPEPWLVLAAVAVAGKLTAMFAFYTWLIANGRGDLLAFDWDFDNESEAGPIARMLSKLKYLTKNDFVVFLAMMFALVGALPYFLFLVAPGQFVIASSVIVQRLRRA
ncbi:MAG: CDP-alcohol phosphatidyltransferase family protein, partial [Persicimonas sp.]